VAGSGAGTLSASSASWTRRGTSPAISPKLTTAAPGGRAARASRRSRDRAALADRHAPLRRLSSKRSPTPRCRPGSPRSRAAPAPPTSWARARSIEFWWPSTWQRRASMAPRSTRSGTPSAPLRHPRGQAVAPSCASPGRSLGTVAWRRPRFMSDWPGRHGLAGKTWTGSCRKCVIDRCSDSQQRCAQMAHWVRDG
jgi:hypothetical protein